MVIEFRRKETIFNTFLLPSKLSSSSHMIPLFFAFFSKNSFPTRSWFKEWHMRGEKKDLKSLVRAIWLWKRKTHYIESGKANLRAEDTCKLGYSCLPTNRCLSSKCHRMHHLPLKQTGNYTGERARAATPREENCWCVASSRPAFCNLDQKKKKKNSTALHFYWQMACSSGERVSKQLCQATALPPAVSGVFPKRRGGQTPLGALWGLADHPLSRLRLCWGCHRARAGAATLLQPAAATSQSGGALLRAFISITLTWGTTVWVLDKQLPWQPLSPVICILRSLFVPLLQSVGVFVFNLLFTSRFYLRMQRCLTSPIALILAF